MKVVKASQGGEPVSVNPQDLALINRWSRKELSDSDVFPFAVRLCDNEIDRDGERFAPQTLADLASLFVGKCGVFDHRWSAKDQTARIYKTEVVSEPARITRAGDPYCWLKGWAYMLRTPGNQELIAQIEGGIKKEVSVACSVQHAFCSICGSDLRQNTCQHQKGERYDGKLCYASLENAQDAYEFSFVAVPAQPDAGIVKNAKFSHASLKSLVKENPYAAAELNALEQHAALGEHYLDSLRQDVTRLGMLAGLGLDQKTLRSITEKLDWKELEALQSAWARKAGDRYPIQTQLRYQTPDAQREEDDKPYRI